MTGTCSHPPVYKTSLYHLHVANRYPPRKQRTRYRTQGTEIGERGGLKLQAYRSTCIRYPTCWINPRNGNHCPAHHPARYAYYLQIRHTHTACTVQKGVLYVCLSAAPLPRAHGTPPWAGVLVRLRRVKPARTTPQVREPQLVREGTAAD